MIKEWKAGSRGSEGHDWLTYLGVREASHYIYPIETGSSPLYSYEGCVYLAEMMPEEYRKWQTLYRIGVTL